MLRVLGLVLLSRWISRYLVKELYVSKKNKAPTCSQCSNRENRDNSPKKGWCYVVKKYVKRSGKVCDSFC